MPSVRKSSRTAGQRALSQTVPVTRRHTADRHHLQANIRPSTGWTGLLEAHGSLAGVLSGAVPSGGTGTSCWRWRTVCGMSWRRLAWEDASMSSGVVPDVSALAINVTIPGEAPLDRHPAW